MSARTRIKPGLRFHGDHLAEPGTLDFAVNVWPGDRPRQLRRALRQALLAETYPDESAAVTAIARRFRRPRTEVLPTNGAGEAFWLLAHALRPRHAACVHPSFTEPEAALRQAGARVTQVLRHEDDWSLDPAAVPDDADLVVVGNPSSPTGNVDPPGRIAALARPGQLLVVDEAFMDFVRRRGSSLAERRDVPGLVVIRSLTKLWSLAGIRVWPSEVNYLLLEVPDGPATVNALRAEGIVVRPASSFPGLGPNHLRVAVRLPEENARLAAALEAALE